MANRRKPKEDVDADSLGEPTASEIEFSEFLEELGEGAGVQVTIYRWPKAGATMEWCEMTSLDQATLEVIKEKHGPGKYRLLFRGPSGFLGSKVIAIAAPYLSYTHTATTAPSKDGTDMFLREQLAQQQTLLLALIGSLKGPDVGSMLSGLGTMMQANKPSVADPVAMFTSVMTAVAAMKSPNEEDWLKKARDLIGLAKDLNPGGGAEDNMFTAVKEVGKEIVDAFAGRTAQPVNSPGNVVTRPALPPGAQLMQPQPGAVQEIVKPAPKTQEENTRDWISAQLRFMKQKATAGKDVDFWIDYIFENDEEPGCMAIIQALEHGATFEHLLQFDQEIAQNPQLTEWFRRLYDGLRSEIDKAVDSSGAAGHKGNAGGHAEPGAAGLADSRSPSTS